MMKKKACDHPKWRRSKKYKGMEIIDKTIHRVWIIKCRKCGTYIKTKKKRA